MSSFVHLEWNNSLDKSFSVLDTKCLLHIKLWNTKFCLFISPPKIKLKPLTFSFFSCPAQILEVASSTPTLVSCLAHSPAPLNVTRSSEICSVANIFHHFLCSSHTFLAFQSHVASTRRGAVPKSGQLLQGDIIAPKARWAKPGNEWCFYLPAISPLRYTSQQPSLISKSDTLSSIIKMQSHY